MPESVPLVLNERPAGSVEFVVKVYGVFPLVALRVNENGLSTWATLGMTLNVGNAGASPEMGRVKFFAL